MRPDPMGVILLLVVNNITCFAIGVVAARAMA
jgi:hypothetical protein